MAIPLTFGWPDGLAVRVEQDRTLDTERDGTVRHYRSRNSFVLVRRGDTIRVCEHHREVGARPPPPPGAFDFEPALRMIEECAPSFVLNVAAGSVSRLVDGVGDEIRQAIAPPAGHRRCAPRPHRRARPTHHR